MKALKESGLVLFLTLVELGTYIKFKPVDFEMFFMIWSFVFICFYLFSRMDTKSNINMTNASGNMATKYAEFSDRIQSEGRFNQNQYRVYKNYTAYLVFAFVNILCYVGFINFIR